MPLYGLDREMVEKRHKIGFPPIIGFGRIIFSYDSSSDIVLRLFDNVSHVACAAKKYFQFNLLVD